MLFSLFSLSCLGVGLQVLPYNRQWPFGEHSSLPLTFLLVIWNGTYSSRGLASLDFINYVFVKLFLHKPTNHTLLHCMHSLTSYISPSWTNKVWLNYPNFKIFRDKTHFEQRKPSMWIYITANLSVVFFSISLTTKILFSIGSCEYKHRWYHVVMTWLYDASMSL